MPGPEQPVSGPSAGEPRAPYEDGATSPGEGLLSALRLAREGRVFDLEPPRFPYQPIHSAHPPFQLLTYRTPRGQRVQDDLFDPADNSSGFGFVTELLIATMHTGTHIDALSHITAGESSEWFGDTRADDQLGDFGPMTHDASVFPPLIARGVLLDVAGLKGVERLPESYPITVDDCARALASEGTEIRPGDVVLIRTGQMSRWPDGVRPADREAGITLETAEWLAGFQPVAVGSDTSAVEVSPSGVDGNPQPVHVALIRRRGIYLIEWVSLEELAKNGRHEFLFICLPLKIRGGTASMVRPVAIT